MSYEVLVEHLRAAAGKLTTMTAPLASYDFEETAVSGESFGHVELAEWFTAVAEQCDRAGTALHDGAATLSTALTYSANQYELTDQGIAGIFSTPVNEAPFLQPPLLPPAPGPK